jgi:hypothetical protein
MNNIYTKLLQNTLLNLSVKIAYVRFTRKSSPSNP